MQNDAAATEFTKPSRLSIFWWRNYFADDPSSIFKEKDVYYDRQGTLNYPTDRAPPFAYWGHNSGSWYWLAYWNCGGAGTSNNDCDCGRTDSCDGDGCLLALGIIVAFFAIIMAAMIVFTWPPSMIISWTVLVIGSFVEVINGKNPSCLNFRIYNATSAAAVLLYLIHVTLAVYQLQNNYNGYYPGTPGIKINVDRLLSFFKRSKLIFAWICLPAILLMIGGIIVGSCVNVSVCASFSSWY